MGIGEWIFFTFLVTLIFLAAGKGSATPINKGTKKDKDLERIREMQEWDRISHGEHANRSQNK